MYWDVTCTWNVPPYVISVYETRGRERERFNSVPTQGSYSHQELTNKERDYQIYEQINKKKCKKKKKINRAFHIL